MALCTMTKCSYTDCKKRTEEKESIHIKGNLKFKRPDIWDNGTFECLKNAESASHGDPWLFHVFYMH